jgi:4-hydroxy-tetrahydrodipicolinate reductase
MLVAAQLASAEGVRLVGGVEAPGHEAIGKKLTDVLLDSSLDGRVVEALSDLGPDAFDVLVDFSVPRQSELCARFSAATGTGLVVATTGLNEAQTEAVRAASSRAAVVLASNTSVGANVLFALLERAGTALGEDFDIEIVEAHHRGKRDAPSGTALTAAGILARAQGRSGGGAIVTGRTGMNTPRNSGEIGVHSVRGGSIAGRHTIHFLSDLETLSLEHVALSREAFAIGAVRAARFAAVRRPGLYDMLDVLGLRGPADREGGEGNTRP